VIPGLESHTSHVLTRRDLSRSHGITTSVCILSAHNVKKKIENWQQWWLW